jgi:hypothetical protein
MNKERFIRITESPWFSIPFVLFFLTFGVITGYFLFPYLLTH